MEWISTSPAGGPVRDWTWREWFRQGERDSEKVPIWTWARVTAAGKGGEGAGAGGWAGAGGMEGGVAGGLVEGIGATDMGCFLTGGRRGGRLGTGNGADQVEACAGREVGRGGRNGAGFREWSWGMGGCFGVTCSSFPTSRPASFCLLWVLREPMSL